MRTFSLLFVLLGSITPLLAEQYFVLFDASCMQRMEYEQAISQQPRMAYFSYQIPLANDTYLTLETGVEGAVTQAYLPAGYLQCGDPVINSGLADRINGNSDRVFMLVPDGAGGFLVQPVTMATIRNVAGTMVNYESPLASFSFDTKNAIIGENLSINNPGARVFFEGRDNALCTSIYLFRQLMPRNAYPIIDYKLSNELGIIERRLGSDGNSTLGGVIILRKVNALPLNSYLAGVCAQTQTAVVNNPNPAANQPNVYYNNPVIPGQTTVAPPTTPTTNIPVATAPATMHTVARGETLYALSRRYTTSVDQIKEWNNLSGNSIAVGQQLRVSNPVASAVPRSQDVAVLNPSTSVPGATIPYTRGPVANSNPGSAQPVPYSNPPVVTTPNQSQDYYIAQAGETVASVALRLGYTEARFREINDLGPREVIRVGQRLKTNDCNCPAATTSVSSSSVRPQTYSGTPATYGQTPVAPGTVGQPATRTTGTAIGPNAQSTSRVNNQTPVAPGTFQGTRPNANRQPRNVPNTANNGPVINNDPSFSAVIPEAYQPPRQSMSDLEGNRSTTPAPRAYGNSPNPYGNTNAATPSTYNQPSANRSIHVVQQGESLYSISNRYGITVEQLRNFNGLAATDVIIPFQRLYVN